MAFLGKCAIHKSNPRIWRRLMNFGLHPNPCSPTMIARNKGNQVCMVVDGGTFYNTTEDNIDEQIYDCKDNEGLFFALAALRDDSDLHQWFVYDNRTWNDEKPTRFWFICKQDKVEDDMCHDQMFTDCEKATKEELIAHFTGWDDDDVAINQ